MCKLLINIVFCGVICIDGLSQFNITNNLKLCLPSTIPQDKLSWQQLDFLLTNNFYCGAKQNKGGSDSSMIYTSNILGTSRFVVAGEGIDDPDSF